MTVPVPYPFALAEIAYRREQIRASYPRRERRTRGQWRDALIGLRRRRTRRAVRISGAPHHTTAAGHAR